MNKMIALAAVLGSAFLFTPAQAAPLGNVSQAAETAGSSTTKVDYRGYRHCHWRYGRRWCHGGHGYRGYGGPGIGIYIGPRHRHYRGYRSYRGGIHRGYRGHGKRGFGH